MSSVGSGGGAIGASAGGLQQVMDLRRQILERSDALRTLEESTKGGAPDSPAAVGGGFADAFKGAVESVNATQLRASEISAAYERGEVTDVAQVMLARQESGIAFEATLQVRNKLLSAYQDIMRMGV
jgi:flagellar hook-basal body complex protein FliE